MRRLKIGVLVWLPLLLNAQQDITSFWKPSDTLNTSRRNFVVISEVSLASLSLVGLNALWYSDFERSKFRTIDDFNEWQQLDKVGHVYSAFHLSRLGAESLEWSGASKNNQLVYGSALGLGFLTAVEIFDGFSEEWGFSWSDIGANTLGTTMYVGQELLWDEQRITLKYSFSRTGLASENPEKLGENFLKEVFKDYNGQTYWLSFNLKSFFPESKLPDWLNLAIGYGGYGMLTGINDPTTGIFGNQDRFRQYYLSLDVDLTRIHTNSHFLKTLFSLINVLKIPSPAIEFTSKNRLNLYWLHY